VNVQTMSTLFALLTVVAQLAVLAIFVLAVGARTSASFGRARDAVWDTIGPNGIWLAWTVALTCTLGSLYYSEMVHFTPCKLCWYQRIAMYPLAVLLLIAAVRRDRDFWHYAVPMAAIGVVLSTYHYQLERFPHQSPLASCSAEAPCTLVWLWRFHYISIPMMALSGFALIIALLLVTRRAGFETFDGHD
jgi:disulfide bond formation protein DsbB